MNWNEIFESAVGAGCGEPALKTKDEARDQTRTLMMELGHPDPDEEDCPEDCIEAFCEKLSISFDESGNIVSVGFPDHIREMIYREKDDEYLREDILNELEERKDFPDVSEDMIQRMMQEYRHIADCNIPYNSTIEAAVDSILKGERDGESN